MFATLELPVRDDSVHKRLKVGRACLPCRQKKIKCDGKHPCMQCKARRRKCAYVKISDDTYIKLDPVVESAPLPESYFQDISDVVKEQKDRAMLNSASKPFVSKEPETLFAMTPNELPLPGTNIQPPVTRQDKMIEQLTDGLVQLTLHKDASRLASGNITPWRNYGDIVRWSPEPPLPTHYTASIDMPTRQMQEHLISVFFNHCHHLLPTFSRGMFYDQLHSKGPLITPLLLNAMYAHAAKHMDMSSSHSQKDDPATQANVFYDRARQLVDDFLDVPRVSTVIALLYMASFDHNTSQQGTRMRSKRGWMYSGMALRMCMDLGLHTANYSSQMSQFDIELRKRVLWTCYVMDKLESFVTERPWMLTTKDIALESPTPLPEDDADERVILEGFGQLCRLMMLMEKILFFFTYEAKKTSMWTIREEQQTLQFLDELRQWRDNLPAHLQWVSNHSPLQYLTSMPSASIMVNLHLVCFDLELSLLLCCRYQDESTHCQRRRDLANTITFLVSATVQNQNLMHSFTLSAFSGIFAAMTHAVDFDHPASEIAEASKKQFRRSLEEVRAIVQHTPIQDMQKFARLVDLTLGLGDVGERTVQYPTSVLASPPYLDAFSAISDLCQEDKESTQHVLSSTATNLFAGQQDIGNRLTPSDMFGHASPGSTDPFDMLSPILSTSTAGHQSPLGDSPQAQFPFESASLSPGHQTASAVATTAAAKAAAAAAVGAVGAPTFGSHRGIEPADYTFELISVADEWARSFMF